MITWLSNNIFPITISLFIVNSTMQIRKAEKELREKDFSRRSQTRLIFVLFAHTIIIVFSIAFIFMYSYTILNS